MANDGTGAYQNINPQLLQNIARRNPGIASAQYQPQADAMNLSMDDYLKFLAAGQQWNGPAPVVPGFSGTRPQQLNPQTQIDPLTSAVSLFPKGPLIPGRRTQQPGGTAQTYL